MRAMQLDSLHQLLREVELPTPLPGPDDVLLEVLACGVCRTDLHIIDGEVPAPKLPLTPGHEAVGVVAARGTAVDRFQIGDRVGVPWLGWTCGVCEHCRAGRENLCTDAQFTGLHRAGGYATHIIADARYCVPIPRAYSDIGAAPLLCAGLIGYRSYTRAGEARRIGFYGFGAAAHLLVQVARHEEREVYAFTRPGDVEGQAFARGLGAVWAGDSATAAPVQLDAAIIFAPVGALVPVALRAVRAGGVVVCAGIHMSDIPAFPYELLWGERTVCSVANLTRRDAELFFALAPQVPVEAEHDVWPLQQANEAIAAFRTGRVHGAAVLVPSTLSRGPTTFRSGAE
ncbi:MAG: zinc-binding alcohol dehydrogenase family protein [Luteitalea sp.]|nr:zinc-binding alcohol dehydrogenase family protein [Luteitalea sp.]